MESQNQGLHLLQWNMFHTALLLCLARCLVATLLSIASFLTPRRRNYVPVMCNWSTLQCSWYFISYVQSWLYVLCSQPLPHSCSGLANLLSTDYLHAKRGESSLSPISLLQSSNGFVIERQIFNRLTQLHCDTGNNY